MRFSVQPLQELLSWSCIVHRAIIDVQCRTIYELCNRTAAAAPGNGIDECPKHRSPLFSALETAVLDLLNGVQAVDSSNACVVSAELARRLDLPSMWSSKAYIPGTGARDCRVCSESAVWLGHKRNDCWAEVPAHLWLPCCVLLSVPLRVLSGLS